MTSSTPFGGLLIFGLLMLGWLMSSSSLIQAQRLTADQDLTQAREMGLAQSGAGVELSPGSTQRASAGSVVTFTHVLTNTGNGPDTFAAQATSSQGWPVALIGDTYPTGTLYLPLPLNAGMTATLQVSLTIPSGSTVIIGAVDKTVITVTSQISPALFVTATDTTIVSRPSRIFLPLVVRYQAPVIKLGVDFGTLTPYTDVLTYDLPLAKQMGATWMRVELPWFKIEKTPGQYDWEPYDVLFTRMGEVGFKPLPIVYGAPSWAANHSCGPISDTLAFENFLAAALTRYGSFVDAWEFTNEPDGRNPHPWGPSAGCWGRYPKAYADQLGIFYAKVKSLDPGALVVFGGLAYDNWVEGNVERNFITETLRYGAGRYFDVANVHYYPINRVEFPTPAHKVNEIRSIMSRQGVYGKVFWVTETGMWVNNIGVEGLNGSVELQRDFIVREFARGLAAGVDNVFWFDPREHDVPPGAVHRWLISLNHEPINGYNTFQHFASKMEGASFTDIYRNVPTGVEAYRFTAPGRSLYILWSNTVTQTVTIPASTSAILTNRDGNLSRTIPVQGSQVSFEVGLQPMFLEVASASVNQGQYRLSNGKPKNGR